MYSNILKPTKLVYRLNAKTQRGKETQRKDSPFFAFLCTFASLRLICKRVWFVLRLTILMSVGLLMGCSSDRNTAQAEAVKQWMTSNGKVKVLSTIAMIDNLVKEIGGEYVDTVTLIRGELDPHSYQLVKGDDEKLAFADIIFSNGLGLEHGASLHSYLTKHPKVIALGDRIHHNHPALILYYKEQLDPHIWMDMSLWSQIVPDIVQALSNKDPEHTAAYEANGDIVIANLLENHQQLIQILGDVPAPRRYLVTSHDAFNYFARAYLAEDQEPEKKWRERFVAPEGLAPESQISTGDIQFIIRHLEKYNIRVIFPESNVNRDSIRKIVQAANEKGLDVHIATIPLYADAMGPSGSAGDTYIKMMLHDAKTIATQLK